MELSPCSSTEFGSTSNRASKGSQRQLQDYVNVWPETLNKAILTALPSGLREIGATIRWVSPLASSNYVELRDSDFLESVGLRHARSELADFWPSQGPCWDALGVISDSAGHLKPGVVLIEAKSHIAEIYGSGCQASEKSRLKIDRALATTKRWLGVRDGIDWCGPLYQYANRLAHLFFLLKRVGIPAWLVNLYFLNDPIGPTTETQWRAEIQAVKTTLGLNSHLPNAIDLFLPVISSDTDSSDSPVLLSASDSAELGQVPRAVPFEDRMTITQDTSFTAWVQEWAQLANYRGPILADPETRMRRLLDLWDQPIPGKWHRPITNTPSRLLGGRRYTRDDEASPRNGEHRIEKEILSGNLDSASCLGAQLLDGVNAYPLVCDTGGGRNGNVEADLFLLTKDPTGCRLIIAEVKDSANNTWYAAVENLRQMKLLLSYEDPGELFRQRNPGLQLPAEMPIIGAVIAPQSFYEQNGQKANSVGPALILLRAFRLEKNVDIRFVVWDCGRARLLEFERVSSSLVKNVATELAAPLADRVASMKPAKRALQLKTSPDDALRQISSIPHNRCAKAINDHWHTEVDGGIRAQSALWLFCWAKTGMNSQTAKVVAAEVFDRIMSVSFAEFDNVVNHEYARESRYADRNIEHELAEMVSRIPRRAQ